MKRREKIEKIVEKNPGIGISELKEKTGFENGVLQHHITKSDKIERKNSAVLEKNRCRKCEIRSRCENKCLMKILRDDKKQKIIGMLESGYSQQDIAEKLDLDKSTISYHVNDLKDRKIIDEEGKLDRRSEKALNKVI